MPLGDFGALSVFGIQCKTSESVLEDHEGYSRWKTDYYGDSRSQAVGMSISVGKQWLKDEMAFSKWETCYYDTINSRTIGSSIAVGKNYCRANLSFLEWETTYYAADGFTVICNSTSLGKCTDSFTDFSQRNTRYYKGTLCVSHSFGSDWMSGKGFRKWETNYAWRKLFVRLEVQEGENREINAQRVKDAVESPPRQHYMPMKQAQEEARTKSPEKIIAARESIEIPALIRYYESTASFFNASRKIFKGSDPNEVVKALETRARKNPGGASDKTLAQFNLKLI